ncbi:cephalosporin hydroxylase family protein [Azospirillum lipoferum]|nr:CmcI family methyltransferase [Azospirillum lipoferum]
MTENWDEDREFSREVRVQAAAMAADADFAARAHDILIRSFDYDSSYQWRWLGMPFIQLPPDVMALQEIIWNCRPTVIVETGVARGGSLIFYASMMRLLGGGRVVGVEVALRPENRKRLADHPFGADLEIIDGSSTDPEVVTRLQDRIAPDDRVMVVLDSNHSHDHVLAELRLYAPLVTPGQYLVVCDTIADHIVPPPRRPRPWGPGNSPLTARNAFLAECQDFAVDTEIDDKLVMTSNRGGYLRRLKLTD